MRQHQDISGLSVFLDDLEIFIDHILRSASADRDIPDIIFICVHIVMEIFAPAALRVLELVRIVVGADGRIAAEPDGRTCRRSRRYLLDLDSTERPFRPYTGGCVDIQLSVRDRDREGIGRGKSLHEEELFHALCIDDRFSDITCRYRDLIYARLQIDLQISISADEVDRIAQRACARSFDIFRQIGLPDAVAFFRRVFIRCGYSDVTGCRAPAAQVELQDLPVQGDGLIRRCRPCRNQQESSVRKCIFVVESYRRIFGLYDLRVGAAESIRIVHGQADIRILRELSVIGEEICSFFSISKSTLPDAYRCSEVSDLISLFVRDLRCQIDVKEVGSKACILYRDFQLVSGSCG